MAKPKRPADTTKYVIVSNTTPWQFWDGKKWSDEKDAKTYIGEEVFPVSDKIPNCTVMRSAFATLNMKGY